MFFETKNNNMLCLFASDEFALITLNKRGFKMKCPFCLSTDTKVLDKRDSGEGVSTRRRRECLNPKCEKRFTTYERIENLNIVVVKKDNSREAFNRDKIEKGMLKACEKRPVSLEAFEKAVDEIEAKILSSTQKEVNSELIGELVMRKLKRLDKVAYIRFASVYRDFADLKSFEEELKLVK